MESIQPRTILKLRELVDCTKDAVVSKVITKSAGGTTTLFAFDKGQGLTEHTSPFDATVLIVSGTCSISIEDEAFTLTEGEMIIMPANIPHALEAKEAFKMLLMMNKPVTA